MAQYITRDSNGWVRWENKPRLYVAEWKGKNGKQCKEVEFDGGCTIQDAVRKPKGWPDLKVGQIVRVREVPVVDGKIENPKPRK